MKTFSSNKNFTLKLKFEIDKPNQAKRSIGANTLYSPNKGNSYFLIDIDKIDKDKPWIIHTNNYRFNNIDEYSFISEKEYPNDRFLISKFLTYFFKNQRVIPSKKRNYYFDRVRQLLITQRKSIINRLKSKKSTNRKTKTFIKFSYKHTTFYFGFYEKCHCNLPQQQSNQMEELDVTCIKKN